MYCYMGASYELFVVMHLLKRILIHQKTFSTINWINNLNLKIPEKPSILDISMPPRQLLGTIHLFTVFFSSFLLQKFNITCKDLQKIIVLSSGLLMQISICTIQCICNLSWIESSSSETIVAATIKLFSLFRLAYRKNIYKEMFSLVCVVYD